jgi:8-oxo-dGTP pyrophosphatase MutT (NUDIX family)
MSRFPVPTLAHIRPRLEPYRGPGDDPGPRPGGWLASVALVLRSVPGSAPELLLIRRSQAEGDPWSGHMAFPGGRKEAADPSLLATAIRETREEVALSLDRLGEPLGRLGLVQPMSPHLPVLTVVPFVFHVPPPAEARVASPEVAEIHWVSLDHLQDIRNRIMFRYRTEAGVVPFPAIDVAGRHVWGLTHRILSDFLRRVASGQPDPGRG